MTPEREAEVLAARVGATPQLNGTIHLEAYDPAWPQRYADFAGFIRRALGDRARLLEHVGSTAVPGLSAKPVIDMVLAVQDSSDEPAYVPDLVQAGYVLHIREPGWHQHRLLRAPVVAGNLHVFSADCSEIGRMLVFRDRLRAHAGDRLFYEAAKHALAGRIWKYEQEYADAKTGVVEEILRRAQA
ncbi:MAG: GrpB family protein [Proteobacteria bacterium]|jgi:GrpB-like predicted nucleotidyltransferase (UPF0157 family)|nr:GrpB family protein [Pseudomonadota bacterium]